MTRRLRLTWVATHPSQYLAPFLRFVTARCPEIELTALFASVPNAAQHGREFGVDVDWGVPLVEGYRAVIMRPARAGDVFTYDRLRGIDVAGVSHALRDTAPDVVLVPGWHSMFLLRAIAAARRLGVPMMYRGDSHLHSSGTGLKRALAHVRARWLLSRFTTGLAVGQRAREYLLALGMPAARVFDVRHCVDNAFFAAGVAAAQGEGRAALRRAFGLDESSFTVLFVGKLAAHKNVDDVIAAAGRLGHAITWHVVGSGPDEARYRDAAGRAGVRIVFSGFLNQQQLVRAYASADCLLLPSRETWGLVCNEALASGIPLVLSDAAGSAPDLVIPGVTGELFRYGDVSALVDAVERVRHLAATDPGLAARCRAHAAAYSFEVVAPALAGACFETAAAVPMESARAVYS